VAQDRLNPPMRGMSDRVGNITMNATLCESTDTGGKGARITKSLGVRRIRRCRGCGRKFTPKNQPRVELDARQRSSAQRETASPTRSAWAETGLDSTTKS